MNQKTKPSSMLKSGSMKKVDLNEKIEKEQEDALEFYMKKCSQLEQEVERLKERVNRLVWQLEEHD